MNLVRELFSSQKPIDRRIEKVIDYYATDDDRLEREVGEYIVTERIETCLRRFLDAYGEGTRTGNVTEIGIWVSGFYGSGKSSFTKYLGFALDPTRKVGESPFLNLFCERIPSKEIQAQLRTLVSREPAAVVMLDLGAEQLADTATATVSAVLYWKVMQWAKFSKEKKLARLELTLDEHGRLDEFRAAYRRQFPGKGEWDDVHDDPLVGIARADQLVPEFLPDDFPERGQFRTQKFEETLTARQQAERMLDLIRRKSGCQNVVFLIDEAGQYVAPRGELILNLDGLSRNLKELGRGKVWIVATGQQTLTEIVEKAIYNSAELNKLRDRFPISIELDAQDIRQITYRRLLTKSSEGRAALGQRFREQGQAAVNYTRLAGTSLFKSDPNEENFAKYYPFLPHHFDLLMELVRELARARGGVGLRSVIRVIQDLLVDASHSLAAGRTPLADRAIGTLACADDFFDTLRADVNKVLPHVVRGVENVEKVFAADHLAVRVAKAVAALQPMENDKLRRDAENLAALVYPRLGSTGLTADVKDALARLVAERECGLVDDPQAGGYVFLDEGIKRYREQRAAYMPTNAELNQLRVQILGKLFPTPPAAVLEGIKKVQAGVAYGKSLVTGPGDGLQFRIESCAAGRREARQNELLVETAAQAEWTQAIAWLAPFPERLDDLLADVRRSEFILSAVPERDADKAVAQFLRSERRHAEVVREEIQQLFEQALAQGVYVFHGAPTVVAEAGQTLEAACRQTLSGAAAQVFPKYRLAPIQADTDLAVRFLSVERLDRMPQEADPLRLVGKAGHKCRVQTGHPALAEAFATFRVLVENSGTGRLQGKEIQEHFADSPYGWTKDTTRYLFAALFRAGEIEIHTADGAFTAPGPKAIEAFKSAVSFNRAGASLRDARPPLEALDLAAQRLEKLFAIEALPLEDHISRAVRTYFPTVLEQVGSLPVRLKLLGLPGADTAQQLVENSTDLLKEDASAATVLLGARGATVGDRVEWARAVVKCLDAGGEDELRRAASLLTRIEELAQLFPHDVAQLTSDDALGTIREVLRSETFYERLAELRGAVRRFLDHVAREYRLGRDALGVACREALREMEGLPSWRRLSSDDQKELANRITSVVPPPDLSHGNELSDFQLLLVRRGGMEGLLALLREEAKRRAPESAADDESTANVERLRMSDLAEPEGDVVIADEADLDAWLARLRSRLVALLEGQRRLRIQKG
ncbi:MAG TPA: BREX system P-loop protein BrxC [Pirellulales bacterium]|nr:BREX system P-loop protein BrxC [Pirellulales bacterium]